MMTDTFLRTDRRADLRQHTQPSADAVGGANLARTAVEHSEDVAGPQ